MKYCSLGITYLILFLRVIFNYVLTMYVCFLFTITEYYLHRSCLLFQYSGIVVRWQILTKFVVTCLLKIFSLLRSLLSQCCHFDLLVTSIQDLWTHFRQLQCIVFSVTVTINGIYIQLEGMYRFPFDRTFVDNNVYNNVVQHQWIYQVSFMKWLFCAYFYTPVGHYLRPHKLRFTEFQAFPRNKHKQER